MRELLLTPSLSEQGRAVGLYSLNTSLLLGFLGGPLPLVLYSALNSYRLKRTGEYLVYLLAVLGYVGLMSACILGTGIGVPQALYDFLGGSGGARVVSQVYAMLLWASFYLMHKRQHRSMSLFGVPAPSPWIALVACFALGFGLQWVLTFGILWWRG